MTKRVLLCGEGPTDYGSRRYASDEWDEGPVQPIIRKSINVEIVFNCSTLQNLVHKFNCCW